jgi:hypothetical protein
VTFAQGRNFAGTWMVDYERTPRGVQARSGGAGLEPAGDAPPVQITLDATHFSFGPRKYKLDGTTTIESPVGPPPTAKTSWKGDKLVIEESWTAADGSPRKATITWYLEGASLVREISSVVPDTGESRVHKTYYNRK